MGKPLGLDIVDTCSDLLPDGECDNLKSKYKIVTLSFFAFSRDHPGKYKIRNLRGDSEELEVLEVVDGKPGSSWGEWSLCSISCIGEDGRFGVRTRERSALPPRNGGRIFTDVKEFENCGGLDGPRFDNFSNLVDNSA